MVFPMLMTLALAACGKVDNAQHAAQIRALVGTAPAWVDDNPLGRRLWKLEQAFYASREFMPAWVDGDAPTPQMSDLLSQLRYSARHGLDPERYGVEAFERLRDASQARMRGTRFPLDQIPELDAKMTYAFLLYSADLLGWNANPRDIDPNWLSSPKQEDLPARLSAAIAAHEVRDALEGLAPTHSQYKGLQAALALEEATPAGHAETIRMNLERWRWLPRDLGERYILINVPTYQLQVMERETPVLSMRVIVGLPDKPTPIFSDEMTYVVFSPYWNIPESILHDETLPRMAKDSDYLRRNNIEVLRAGQVVDPSSVDWSDPGSTEKVRFRQIPGPENALGLVKFIFPNNFSVYLHDTPDDRLFARTKRALSHGCIRVEEPVELAKYVFRDQPAWTDEKIREAMSGKNEQTSRLKTPLPVHIGYWTAWVEPDGRTVTFAGDPYQLDAKQAQVRSAHGVRGRTARAAAAE
jgi:murein L,D-transpeptidase YcbB/YkuD